jgi:thiopurine S-methyltransferase
LKEERMDKEFWHSKWEKNEIGFHLNDVHPLLKKYFDRSFIDSESVFVPLCGKTLDMRFLYAQNKSVIGCELSEIAIKNFYLNEIDNNSLSLSEEDEHQIFCIGSESQSLKIFVGDFFNLDKHSFNQCQSIYDRAALIALPEELRILYVAHLKKLLPQATMLLITLDYQQNKMSGPPFSVEQSEVEKIFSFASVEILKRSDIIEDEPHLKTKGLKHFYQTAYFIEWN